MLIVFVESVNEGMDGAGTYVRSQVITYHEECNYQEQEAGWGGGRPEQVSLMLECQAMAVNHSHSHTLRILLDKVRDGPRFCDEAEFVSAGPGATNVRTEAAGGMMYGQGITRCIQWNFLPTSMFQNRIQPHNLTGRLSRPVLSNRT